jgi:hypothetical protein
MFLSLLFKTIILCESLEPLFLIIPAQTIPFVELLKLIFWRKKILSRTLHNGGFVVWVISSILLYKLFYFTTQLKWKNLNCTMSLEESGELTDKEEVKRKFRLLRPLSKLYNIIVDICSSTSRMAEFLVLAGRMIPLDNHMRWNSWHESLVVADKHASSIDTYTKEHFAKLSEDYLTPEDWKRLRTIKDFLQPFHRATLETQGHRATLETVLFTMDVLVRYFKAALVSKLFSLKI